MGAVVLHTFYYACFAKFFASNVYSEFSIRARNLWKFGCLNFKVCTLTLQVGL